MRRRGFVSLILAGTLAALLYYVTVWLMVERIKTMPDGPPPLETTGGHETEESR